MIGGGGDGCADGRASGLDCECWVGVDRGEAEMSRSRISDLENRASRSGVAALVIAKAMSLMSGSNVSFHTGFTLDLIFLTLAESKR